MNKLNLLKIGFYFILITSMLSCNDERLDVFQEDELVGEWLLNDPTNNCEQTLIFDQNNTGIEIVGCEYSDDTFVSSAESFVWSTDKDIITIDFYGDKTKSSFSFDEEGHLFLPGMTNNPELYFIRVE